jgi:hypothetical protein
MKRLRGIANIWRLNFNANHLPKPTHRLNTFYFYAVKNLGSLSNLWKSKF